MTDLTETAKAYRRRADAREAERRDLYGVQRQRARRVASALHSAFGPHVRVYLFGSLLDLDRFRADSDIDLAVEGLTPSDYWRAWRVVDAHAGGVAVDLVRVETAPQRLRESLRAEGEILT